MKKIAVINDLSGLGKCSLTAAIPVISVMGVQACPFPTAVLSNQTGYETYFCEDFTEHMAPYMEEWKKRGFVPDGIYTGFLSDEKQADKILKFIDTFAGEDTLILTDPVMGDDGAVYPIYTEELCSRFRELARRSYVITPNLTEALLLLYGKNKMEERYYVKVGNCYAAFLGMWHGLVMRSDYHKATPFMTEADAKNEANKRGVKTFKIVKKPFVK